MKEINGESKLMGDVGQELIEMVFKNFLENKTKYSLVFLLISGLFTLIRLSLIGLEYIIHFMDTGNFINIFIVTLFGTFAILIVAIIFLYALDFIFFLLLKSFKYIFVKKIKLKINSSGKTLKMVKTGILYCVIAGMFLCGFSLLLEITYGQSEVKIFLKDETLSGSLMYNTGNGYILKAKDKTLFIPNSKINSIQFFKKGTNKKGNEN